MSSIIKVNDVYIVNRDKMVITHLFERISSKTYTINLHPVKEVNLDEIPPPRRDLHQNRYGQCELGEKRMFMKILSPGFYKRAKQWYKLLHPYAKNLYVDSFFDDQKRIITQPKLFGSLNQVSLKPEFLNKNIKKIKDFLNKIEECRDKDVLRCFSRMDVHRENFMIDKERENFYMVDFDPWTHTNDINVWNQIIKEISK